MYLDGYSLYELTADMVADLDVYYFVSELVTDLSKEAATQLFAKFYPEQYALWRRGCPGQIFDPETFWDTWTVHEIELSSCKILMAREW